jgi:transposase
MSTSLLDRCFCLHGYQYLKTVHRGSETYFHVRDPNPQCAACSSTDVIRDGSVTRTFRLVTIGRRQSFAVLDLPRLRCRACGAKRQARIRFADPMKTYARSFQRLVLDLLDICTVQGAAHFLGAGWDLVKSIQKDHLRKRFAKPPLKKITAIAIDEIHLGRALGYRTLVMDLATGAIVHVGQGKGADALKPFWKRLRGSGARVLAVAMDMSKSYIAAVRKNLPDADIVFDPFHVVKLMNERLDELRRELWQKATGDGKKAIKGSRWVLLKGSEHISAEAKRQGEPSERERLEAALEFNKPLATAYYLKEDLRMLWMFSDRQSGKSWMRTWIEEAEASGIGAMVKMAKTLRDHEDGILAYFKHRITSGPMEGMNNKVRTLMKVTYGLRDEEYLELRLKSLHETKLRLTGRL